MNTVYLEGLIASREQAKRIEETAIAQRRDIDDKIIEAIGRTDEGTINQVIANKRVILTFGIDRKIADRQCAAVLEQLWPSLPQHVRDCFRPVPPDVNVREYKKLQLTDPNAFGVIAKLVVAKPTRPSIKVEDFTPEKESA